MPVTTRNPACSVLRVSNWGFELFCTYPPRGLAPSRRVAAVAVAADQAAVVAALTGVTRAVTTDACGGRADAEAIDPDVCVSTLSRVETFAANLS
jgi:hypothetical protein